MARTRPLEPDALAEIIGQDGYALLPLDAEQRMKARMEVQRTQRRASTDDPGAKALRKRLASVSRILSDDARERLEALPLYWVESALPHAAVFERDGSAGIVVCRGLFDLVHFEVGLTTVCSLLLPIEGPAPADGMGLSQRLHLAGHVILADAYAALRTPTTVADMLGPSAMRDVDLGVTTALVLLLLHELGHVALGHTGRPGNGGEARAVVVSDPGAQGARAQLELAADTYAIDSVADEWRPQMLSSLIFLHNVFHFFEVFGLRPSVEYPSVEVRLARMIDRLGLPEDDRAFAAGWLSDYRRRAEVIAAQPTDAETLCRRFERVMTAKEAYAIVEEIRRGFLARGIKLESPAGSAGGLPG